MEDHTERVRQRAYQIWLDEGRPEGRESIHWDMASELVAIEENQKMTAKRVRRDPADRDVAANRAEPAVPAAAMGDVPTTTDTGEQTYPPSRAAERGTAAAKPSSSQAKARVAGTRAAAKTEASKSPVNKTAAAKRGSRPTDVARSSAGKANDPMPKPRGKK